MNPDRVAKAPPIIAVKGFAIFLKNFITLSIVGKNLITSPPTIAMIPPTKRPSNPRPRF